MNESTYPSKRGVSGAPVTSADASGGVDITDAPRTTECVCLDDLTLSTKVAMDVTFKEETSGTIIDGPYYMPATGSLQITLSKRIKLPTAGKKLRMFTSTSGAVTVTPGWHSEP